MPSQLKLSAKRQILPPPQNLPLSGKETRFFLPFTQKSRYVKRLNFGLKISFV